MRQGAADGVEMSCLACSHSDQLIHPDDAIGRVGLETRRSAIVALYQFIGEADGIAVSVVEQELLGMARGVGDYAGIVGHYRRVSVVVIGLLAAAEQREQACDETWN